MVERQARQDVGSPRLGACEQEPWPVLSKPLEQESQSDLTSVSHLKRGKAGQEPIGLTEGVGGSHFCACGHRWPIA